MNKQEFVSMVAERIDADCSQANNVVNAVFGEIIRTLAVGEKLVIPGFGTFSMAKRAAHMATNPNTGEPVYVPEHTVPVFRPGKTMRDAVDQ